MDNMKWYDNLVVFAGAASPFSNFYPCTVRLYHREFGCTEVAYQWAKLHYFRLHREAEHVAGFQSGSKAKTTADRMIEEAYPKKIGDASHLHDHWRRVHAEDVLFDLNMRKYLQNDLLRTWLKSSHEATLAEGTTDVYWGTGVTLENTKKISLEAEYRRRWGKQRAQNKFGEILMKVRRMIDVYVEILKCDTPRMFPIQWIDYHELIKGQLSAISVCANTRLASPCKRTPDCTTVIFNYDLTMAQKVTGQLRPPPPPVSWTAPIPAPPKPTVPSKAFRELDYSTEASKPPHKKGIKRTSTGEHKTVDFPNQGKMPGSYPSGEPSTDPFPKHVEERRKEVKQALEDNKRKILKAVVGPDTSATYVFIDPETQDAVEVKGPPCEGIFIPVPKPHINETDEEEAIRHKIIKENAARFKYFQEGGNEIPVGTDVQTLRMKQALGITKLKSPGPKIPTPPTATVVNEEQAQARQQAQSEVEPNPKRTRNYPPGFGFPDAPIDPRIQEHVNKILELSPYKHLNTSSSVQTFLNLTRTTPTKRTRRRRRGRKGKGKDQLQVETE